MRKFFTKEYYTIWWQDGQGREMILGRRELRKKAEEFDFDADEVIWAGETEMLDNEGDVVGGVFREYRTSNDV
tara:strand:+ start:556 stop:774 length:219 start_codon:yes stop_codon:yes gene_type:complete